MGKLKNSEERMLKVNMIRERDGDDCYRCGCEMDFEAEPGTDWAPSIEHVVPRLRGGGNALSNLALSHTWCNARATTQEDVELKRRVRKMMRRRAA